MTSRKWPGFWASAKKDAAIKKFNTSVSLADRKSAWSEVQRLYDAVAAVKVGDYYSLNATQKRVQNYNNIDYPPFWNVWLGNHADADDADARPGNPRARIMRRARKLSS